jgi:Helix-turn-helix domain
VSESDVIRTLRRELGRQLAAARKDAGYAQREFAQRIHYARSTLSTVESGVQRAGRAFWDACDSVLGTGGQFARGFDQIRETQAAEREDAQGPSAPRGHFPPTSSHQGLLAPTLAAALPAYQALGWPVAAEGHVAELETGTVLDALEVPRPAGILAACWWQSTGGGADPIRGLPALPHPRRSLAAIACEDQFFFLTAGGSYPWADRPIVADATDPADGPIVRWHSGTSIPAPPGRCREGQYAAWAYLPTEEIQLASPVILLDLLAKAIAATRHAKGALNLPGGVLAVGVHRPSPGTVGGQPTDGDQELPGDGHSHHRM